MTFCLIEFCLFCNLPSPFFSLLAWRRGRQEREEQIRRVMLPYPTGVTPPGTVTLSKGALRVLSNLFQCSPPESCQPWRKGSSLPLLRASQALVMLHNLLHKQKWPMVAFFKEAGMGTRKIPRVDFIQVIKGVCREQNGNNLLTELYVLTCKPRVVLVEEIVVVQQGVLLLVLPSEDSSQSLWKAGGEREGKDVRSGMSSRVSPWSEGYPLPHGLQRQSLLSTAAGWILLQTLNWHHVSWCRYSTFPPPVSYIYSLCAAFQHISVQHCSP